MPDTSLKTAAVPQPAKGHAGTAHAHDSAERHVSGSAVYIDDIREIAGTLHIAPVLSTRAHARILSIDLSGTDAVPGFVTALTPADVPGVNNFGAVKLDDPIIAEELVEFWGQVVLAVAGETLEAARAAARAVKIEYEDLEPILSIERAIELDATVAPPLTMKAGDAAAAMATAKHRLSGTFNVGGQDHFYLEGHIAYAVPQEEGDMLVYSSTQHPTEVQHLVSRSLAIPDHAVTVEVRRMGGGFGGKETQPAQIAAIAALIARKTGRPAKLRLDRDEDMVATGKRHDFLIKYEVGFDDEGRIEALAMDLHARAGYSSDLTNAVVDRAMFHAGNCYFLPNTRITGHRNKTHTVSNTAFRGFGGPQGMLAGEVVVDEIARYLGKDPLAVRQVNFYDREGTRTRTHYGQPVEDFILHELVPALASKAEYEKRRAEVRAFNATSPVLKKGIYLTPVQFGISFTATHFNQAGALVHVYSDGSVMLNHGGTEMGQGLYLKVAQVVAREFGIDVARVKITATNTSKVPNTSATAASSGSDLNGMAAQDAARQIKARLIAFAAGKYGCAPEEVRFADNMVEAGTEKLSFAALAKAAYLARTQLSAAGFYATPKIHWSRETASGHPFYYFAYGAAVAEVIVDTLTGEYRLLRADLLHDVGRSLNPAIDIGQIEGAFVQGTGWLTSEELWWDKAGRLRTHAPSTYKIPTVRDIARDFRVTLYENENAEPTIHRSKAVGEPPFMLANAVFFALKDAVGAAADYKGIPKLDAPATPERVLMAIEALRAG
jgi:xanthine dehydrogenase large subunit